MGVTKRRLAESNGGCIYIPTIERATNFCSAGAKQRRCGRLVDQYRCLNVEV